MKDMNQKQYLPEIPADNDLETILSDAVWAAHSLFRRGKTSGSSANLSVIHNGVIYISASGTCFGTLTTSDFAAVAPDGTVLPGKKPLQKTATAKKRAYSCLSSVLCGNLLLRKNTSPLSLTRFMMIKPCGMIP